MHIHCKFDELVSPLSLRAHPKNANNHPPEQIKRLSKILEYQGWRYPIKVSKRSGYVTSGHGRIQAALLLGWNEVPVNYQDYEDDDQEQADVHSDNAIASWAELDLSAINAQMGDFDPGFDIDLLGIKDFTLDIGEKDAGCDEDETPETPPEPVVKRGELWILGEHRLLIGSSADYEDVQRLVDGQKIDCVFTSPPYNVGLEYNSHDDSLSREEYENLLRCVMKNIKSNQAESFSMLWNKGSWMHQCDYRMDLRLIQEHWEVKRTIVWKKKGITGPPLFHHTKNNPVAKNYLPFLGFEFVFVVNEGPLGTKRIPSEVLDRRMTDVWEVDQSVDSRNQSGHPGAFPVQLAADGLALFSENTVFEPFCGSGTTLIACEKTNRRCFGMEIDPHYGQVIIERYIKFTGRNDVYRLEANGHKTPWPEVAPKHSP